MVLGIFLAVDGPRAASAALDISTGVLRGHEGGPLVIGDTMYVHTPFPNTVYALDLNHDGKIIWKYEPRQDPNVIPWSSRRNCAHSVKIGNKVPERTPSAA